MALKFLYGFLNFNIRYLPLLLFLSLSLHSSAFSQTQAKKEFVVGVEDINYYPYYFFDPKKNEFTGISKDILDLFAQKRGYKFEYRKFPVKRLFQRLLDQQIDFKFPDNNYWNSEEKEKYQKEKKIEVSYTEGIIDYIDGVMVHKANFKKGDNNLKVLGTVLGFTPSEYVSSIKEKKLSLYETTDLTHLLTLLHNKKIDGAYFSVVVARYRAEELGIEEDLVFDNELKYTKSFYRLSSTLHPQIIKEFNEFLINEKVAINDLKVKYKITEEQLLRQ